MSLDKTVLMSPCHPALPPLYCKMLKRKTQISTKSQSGNQSPTYGLSFSSSIIMRHKTSSLITRAMLLALMGLNRWLNSNKFLQCSALTTTSPPLILILIDLASNAFSNSKNTSVKAGLNISCVCTSSVETNIYLRINLKLLNGVLLNSGRNQYVPRLNQRLGTNKV